MHEQDKQALKVGGVSLAVFAALVVFFTCTKTIDTGNRGVKVIWGKAEQEPLAEGFYFYNRFSTKIVEIDTKTKKMESEAETYTKDIQQAKIKITVNYNLAPQMAAAMYSSVGVDWEDALIAQSVQGTVKAVVGKWEAVDLIANRGKAQQEIEKTLKDVLAEKNIRLTGFEMTNIDYSPEFERAVESKVTAIQRAEEAKNNTVKIQEEAKQSMITANALAESMKIKSAALSQNQSLVGYEAVQKWNGVLPTYVMGGQIPFIQIPHEGK